MSELKTYKDSYLYNRASDVTGKDNTSTLNEYIVRSQRITDKKSEAFRGILEDIKRQQTSAVLLAVLMRDDVVICINSFEISRAFKVFEAKDPKNNKKPTIFIDATGLIRYDNGYYYCKKVDVIITYLLEALIYLNYRYANTKTMNNTSITVSGTECFCSMSWYVIDYLRPIGYSSYKSKIIYLIGLFYIVNLMGKPLDSYAKSVAAKIAKLEPANIRAFDLYLDDMDVFENIHTFITFLSKTFSLKGFTTETFVSKWIWLFGTGTQYGCELFTSFGAILAAVYVGSYVVNQKQIERCCGTSMVKFIAEMMKIGNSTFSASNYLEAAQNYVDKNTEELAKAVQNKEALAYDKSVYAVNKKMFNDKEKLKKAIKNASKVFKESNSENLFKNLIHSVFESGLEAILGDEYENGALTEAVKQLKGHFTKSDINKCVLMVESTIGKLNNIRTKINESSILVGFSNIDKSAIASRIIELRELFSYIK